MPDDVGLQFAVWLVEADAIRKAVVAAASSLGDEVGRPELAALRGELAGLAFHGAEPGAPALTVGFVGPFSAGKSSLVRCLTGHDVVVRPEPVSHSFETYDWRGLRFLDTPGIESGRESHDRAASLGVRTSDLIVFVVTPNLFDEATASALRRIAVDDRRAPDMLIVLNKAVSLGGEQASVLGALMEVVEPLGFDRSMVVLTEARDWLDAQDEADAPLAAELVRRSRIADLEVAIDRLAVLHGLTARLTRPLHAIRRIAGDAAALVSAVDPDAERALRLIWRKARALSASEARLRVAVRGVISHVAEQIVECGESAATAVVVGVSPDALRRDYESAVARAESLAASVPELVEKEIAREWKVLMESLVREQQALAAEGAVQPFAVPGVDPASPTPAGSFGPAPPAPRAVAKSDAGRYVDQVQKFGGFLAKHSSGTRAGSGFLTASGAAGSNTHTWIYAAGKYVGIKFKPWEAVRYAKWLGNAGRVLGVVGGILALALAYHEERREQEADRQVSSARGEIRAQFRQFARQFEEACKASLEAFVDLSYGAEQRAISEEREEIVREAATRAERAAPLLALAERADDLASRIAGAGERLAVTEMVSAGAH